MRAIPVMFFALLLIVSSCSPVEECCCCEFSTGSCTVRSAEEIGGTTEYPCGTPGTWPSATIFSCYHTEDELSSISGTYQDAASQCLQRLE